MPSACLIDAYSFLKRCSESWLLKRCSESWLLKRCSESCQRNCVYTVKVKGVHAGFEIDEAATWGDVDSRGFSRQTGSFVDLSGRNCALVKCKDVV